MKSDMWFLEFSFKIVNWKGRNTDCEMERVHGMKWKASEMQISNSARYFHVNLIIPQKKRQMEQENSGMIIVFA